MRLFNVPSVLSYMGVQIKTFRGAGRIDFTYYVLYHNIQDVPLLGGLMLKDYSKTQNRKIWPRNIIPIWEPSRDTRCSLTFIEIVDKCNEMDNSF